jgi:hypothetical protein
LAPEPRGHFHQALARSERHHRLTVLDFLGDENLVAHVPSNRRSRPVNVALHRVRQVGHEFLEALRDPRNDMRDFRQRDWPAGLPAARLVTRRKLIARDIRRDAARKNAVIQRHPWHFAALDQQEVGEMSGHEAAAHSLEQDGFALRDGEDALRMRQAVDHGIALGVARARGTRDLDPNDVLGGIKGGWPAAERLKGVERPSAQDGGETYVDKYLAT